MKDSPINTEPTEQPTPGLSSLNIENELPTPTRRGTQRQYSQRIINEPKNFTIEDFPPDTQQKLIRKYYIPLCGIPVFRVLGIPPFLRQIPSPAEIVNGFYLQAVVTWYEKNQFLLEINVNEVQNLLEGLPGLAKNNLRNLTIIFRWDGSNETLYSMDNTNADLK
jgi:hypothetical protein